MKHTIKLNESDLKHLIKEALNELDWKTYANAAKKRLKQNKDSNFKDKKAFDKYWELRKMANKKFDDEFVGNLKYDTFGDKWKGKHSPKLDTPNIEPGVTPSGRFSGYNKSGNRLFSPNKGSYYSSNGGYTTPRNFFRDAEVADAYVKANDELWDYYNDEYEYKKGEGWKKKDDEINEKVKRVMKKSIKLDEAQLKSLINNTIKRILKENEDYSDLDIDWSDDYDFAPDRLLGKVIGAESDKPKYMSDDDIKTQYDNMKIVDFFIENHPSGEGWRGHFELEFPNADNIDYDDSMVNNFIVYDNDGNKIAFDDWMPQDCFEKLKTIIRREISKRNSYDEIDETIRRIMKKHIR